MRYGGFVVVSADKTSTAGTDMASELEWWRLWRDTEKACA